MSKLGWEEPDIQIDDGWVKPCTRGTVGKWLTRLLAVAFVVWFIAVMVNACLVGEPEPYDKFQQYSIESLKQWCLE